MTWQPIETAPRDGTLVLLAGKWHVGDDWHMLTACWTTLLSVDAQKSDYGWFSDVMSLELWKADFTHWQPLPDPP